jgi:hypothetical protein
VEFFTCFTVADKKFIGTFYREYEKYSGNYFMRKALRTKQLGGVGGARWTVGASETTGTRTQVSATRDRLFEAAW